ncbi:hypothetical protein SAMN04488515_1245 [Cognatiyoonia koreensis]|uniref:Uncharacterized protein n=1 Tax=Cognatiyoonia koreensis TaxID=364200 RepID=A0A1I0PIJ3_9RHOB|nr:hypothetical protein SAMN04488515_1245 [Cognatiyoonia koreensis]
MSPRYCASPSVMNTLRRDGIGCGHDLECGCFFAPRTIRPLIFKRLKRNTK